MHFFFYLRIVTRPESDTDTDSDYVASYFAPTRFQSFKLRCSALGPFRSWDQGFPEWPSFSSLCDIVPILFENF